MGSLLEDIQEVIDNDPEGREFLWSNGLGEQVDNNIIDQHRWFYIKRVVFQRNDEFVAVEYCEGATELQDDTPSEAEAYAVRPVEVTTIRYDKVL